MQLIDHRRTWIFLIAAALLPCGAAVADQTIRCKSRDFHYQYCRAKTHNHVRLVEQHSKTRCRKGDNWGFDRHGVWVDRGCDAEFVVGGDDYRYDARHDSHRRDRDRHDDDDGKKALAAGAAIAGVAIIAALASGSDHSQDDVASWAIGKFEGYDDVERKDLELTIHPGGSVTGYADRIRFSGNLNGRRLETGRHRFTIERSGNGFLATDESDSRHRVMFRRSGAGY